MCAFVPVVIGEAWPPVRSPEQGLQGTGQVHKQVTHQEEPKDTELQLNPSGRNRWYIHMHTHTKLCLTLSGWVQPCPERQ